VSAAVQLAPETKEEQPRVETAPKRHVALFLGAIAAVWLIGWLALRGDNTLAMAFRDQNSFHNWINGLRDDIQTSASHGNWFFDGVIGRFSDGINWVVEQLQRLISTKAFPRPVPQIGWLGVLAIGGWLALLLAGIRSMLLVLAVVVSFGLLGYWQDSMDTLIITIVSVIICIVIGMPLGIAMARRRSVSAAVTPVLDLMQTMPAFAYLAPLALLFGIGASTAVVCTLIYALPPLVRITEHGLRSVPSTTVEAADSLGVSRRQLLMKVQLPMARRTIVVGVNQSMMAALSMATIAALVNGPGLGQPVVAALQILDVGGAAVAGLAIVLMAIMLDRTTTAASQRRDPEHHRAAGAGRTADALAALLRRLPAWTREEVGRRVQASGAGKLGGLLLVLVPVLICVQLSRQYIGLAQFSGGANIGPDLAKWINDATDSVVNVIEPITSGFKNAISYGFLNPLQSLLGETPWWLMALVILAATLVIAGWRAAVVTLACEGIILGTGLWHDSMVTLTTTIVATVLVMIVAMVLGVAMGRNRRADAVIRPVLDTFQVMPPFVYLVPALALFSATRFTAIVAAVAYAVPIATKLVADGIRGVSPTTVEAAQSAGITRWQMISKVQLPMARESLVLAANQGLLYVLSMVVIGGMVGAGSLGYIVVTGFSQTDLFGKGLAAGIAITAMGVMIDRTARHAAARIGSA